MSKEELQAEVQRTFREFKDKLTSYQNDWVATWAEVLQAEKAYRIALGNYENAGYP